MATYISKQSGLWSSATTWLTAANGTFSPTADAGAPPQSGANEKIVIRGAGVVVEYDVNGMFGDGTTQEVFDTEANILSNAICLSGGKLKASRTVSTSLTCNGSFSVNYGTLAQMPWFDWGTETDPITGVNASIYLGSPSNTTTVRHGLHSRKGTTPDNNLQNQAITFCGKSKVRNAVLDRNHSTGTTSLSVVDCTGWEVGDRIITEAPTNFLYASNTGGIINTIAIITNISNNVITTNTPLVTACQAGTYVGNFTSNITIQPGLSSVTGTDGTCNAFGLNFNLNGNNSLYLFKNVSFIDFSGNTGIGGGIISGDATYGRNPLIIDNVSFLGRTSQSIYGFNYSSGQGYNHTLKNIAFYSLGINSSYSSNSLASNFFFYDSVIYRTGRFFEHNGKVHSNITFNNVRGFAARGDAIGVAWTGLNSYFYNSHLRQLGTFNQQAIFVQVGSFVQYNLFDNCTIQMFGVPSANYILGGSAATAGTHEIRNCSLSGVTLSYNKDGNRGSKDLVVNTYSKNRNPLVNERMNSFYNLSGNYGMRNRGLASYEVSTLVTNTEHYFKENISSNINIPKRFVGYIRYTSSYGTNTLPYITFNDSANTSTVTQTFSCSPTPDVWQKFDLTVTPAVEGNIIMTLYSQTSSTNARVYLDGLAFNPINPKCRHYGFNFDETLPNRTVNTLTTLTENQVSAISTINNLDHLYDASNYWSVTNPSLTSYTDLYTRDGNILDFGNRNIVINNSASTGFAYASASSTLTIKTPLLSSGNNFIGLKTTGNIYLSSGSTIGEIDIYGNVYQATPVSLSGIYMEGTLAYNTNSNTTIEYTDCTMDTVQNDGSGIVTIKKTNSTIANGLDAEIADFVPTILNVTLNNGYIAIYDNTGTRQYYQNTDGAIVLPSSATGNWTYRIARYGYQYIQGSFTVDPNTGANITISPTYTPDNFVTSNTTAVAAYTDLETTEKIYNYLNYWSTTSSGIDYTPFYSKAFGSITINKNVNLDATAASILTYNGSTLLTLKCSGLSEDVLFVSTGNVVAQNGTTYSDDVKIRATNLNSELILGGITSMTLFPTQNDRDDNTNEGDTLTGTIYRFLYGSVVNGVTLSGTIYARVDVAGTVLLYSDTISTGGNILEFGTTGTLQQIINNQKVINEGVQKASILVPHTTNI